MKKKQAHHFFVESEVLGSTVALVLLKLARVKSRAHELQWRPGPKSWLGKSNPFKRVIPQGVGKGVCVFICGQYSMVKSLISTCVWCISAQESIGYLTIHAEHQKGALAIPTVV